MAPLALCNYVAYDLLEQGGRRRAGRGRSDRASRQEAVRGRPRHRHRQLATWSSPTATRIIWQRPIPLGGNHFTRALTKDLKLTFAKAEHLKRNAAKSPDLRKILASLKPVLNDFVGEVQRSLGYFTNTHRDAQIEYMVGLGNAFRLPGLQKFLEEKLQLDVRKLQQVGAAGRRRRADGAGVHREHPDASRWPTAWRCKGCKRAKLLTNLLPPEIRTERLIRAKKPWAVAAAAALLIGLAGMMAGYGLNLRSYKNAEVTAAIDSVGATANKANEAKSKFAAAKDKAEKEEESVKSIVAGQGEFLNWLEFISFISKAIPQPDGTNLSESARQKYWLRKPAGFGAMSGEEAFKAYMEQQTGLKRATMTAPPPAAIPGNPRVASATSTPAVEDLPPGIDNLIQVNVESVDARFLDDMAGFWRKVHDAMGEAQSNWRPLEHSHNAPDERSRGWVVEIRGWTFHNKTREFILDTYVENLFKARHARFQTRLRQSALGRQRDSAPNKTRGQACSRCSQDPGRAARTSRQIRGAKKNPCAIASATSCSSKTGSGKPPTPGRLS